MWRLQRFEGAQQPGKRIERHQVPGFAEAGNLPHAHGCDHGTAAEFLPRMDIGKMNLHKGLAHGGNRIADGVAVMRVSPGVEDAGVEIGEAAVDGIDDIPLAVALEEGAGKPHFFRLRIDEAVDVLQGLAAVHRGLAH